MYHGIISEDIRYFYIVHQAVRVLYVVQCLVFMIMIFKYTKKYEKTLLNYYANTGEDSFSKVRLINITIFISSFLYILIASVEKEDYFSDSFFRIAPALFSSCLLFFIGWLGNKQRTVFVGSVEEDKKLRDIALEENDTDAEHFSAIKENIEKLFNIEKIYLNDELTLWELSRLVGTNRTYISIVINHYYKQNFATFVNHYRTKHLLELLKSNPELTNVELAELSGFGSVASMQRAVLFFEGKTIREIKSNCQNE
ncbi:hypothetical protein LJC11_04385 [Bacteroidales bacterium OttesenSCG-928-I21]|nr:hypothetical protein [Bacteroidales bacterium OttesenSCG-928-I21]